MELSIYLVRTATGIRLVRADNEERLIAYLKPTGYPPPTWRKAFPDDLRMYRDTPIEDTLVKT